MTRLLTAAFVLSVLVAAGSVSAQGFRIQFPGGQIQQGHLHDQDHHSHDQDHHFDHGFNHSYTIDTRQLDRYADQLADIGKHLHEDAHLLSQDYEHSAAIERYVEEMERLQHHMHEILHNAVQSGRQSTSLTRHLKEDVRQVNSYLNRLYGELNHQSQDGARSSDFRAMAHMRNIIVGQAMPLVRRMEVSLYGYSHHGGSIHHDDVHILRQPEVINRREVVRPRRPRNFREVIQQGIRQSIQFNL